MTIKVKITTANNMKYFGCEKNTIKEIEFEDYIKCVVASEIGNASLEACKAQAVASRTFAISRGVLDGKVITDTSSNAQAFRAERNNYKNCNAAVEATEGEILMYGGKYAQTYFCHSNGGRTYSCEEVWGSKRNYLIARKDEWTAADGTKKSGHGIGLSQVGALYAAKQGIGYREILSFYYPKTTLTTLEEEEEKEYDRKIVEEIKVRVELALQELKRGYKPLFFYYL